MHQRMITLKLRSLGIDKDIINSLLLTFRCFTYWETCSECMIPENEHLPFRVWVMARAVCLALEAALLQVSGVMHDWVASHPVSLEG